jgi:DNA-binding transcriptional regulator YhcF (GntR family)
MKSMTSRTDRQQKPARHSAASARNLVAAELFSFLNQTRAAVPWTERDLAKTLNVGLNEARQALSVMQFEGYVASAGGPGKWRTTLQGESVSGSKPPRFTRESVEKALSDLSERIRDTNGDPNALYKITDAVAFGDFLADPPRVQSATVGIRLILRNDDSQHPKSAHHKAAESTFLKELRGKSSLVRLQHYEPWMSARSHRNLL